MPNSLLVKKNEKIICETIFSQLYFCSIKILTYWSQVLDGFIILRRAERQKDVLWYIKIAPLIFMLVVRDKREITTF